MFIKLSQFINIIKYQPNSPDPRPGGDLNNHQDFKQNINFQNLPKSNQSQINNDAAINQSLYLNELSLIQVKSLIKDLLKLPAEYSDLLKFITNTPSASGNSLEGINIQDLIKLLASGKKDVINNLIFLLGQNGSSVAKQELSKYISTINKYIPTSQNANETIQQLLILYLPYLPLENQYKIILAAAEKQKKEEESNDKIKKVTIILQTENLGTIKVEIYEQDNQFLTNIYYTENCRQEIRNQINKLISENLAVYKLDMQTKNSKESPKAALKIKPKVIISNDSEISTKLLDVIYKISKIIIDIDEKCSLENSRKKQIENN